MPSAERVPVLMYHRVGAIQAESESRYCVSPERFAAQMRALARSGYRAVSVETLVGWLDGNAALGPHDFVLTFDDGFLGVRDHALPILKRLNWPFSVFLVTGLLGAADDWKRNDGTVGGRHPLMSADDVFAMRQEGCSFHSHTRTHSSLTQLDDAALQAELVDARDALARLLGEGVRYLAYPYGHVDDRVEAAARAAGYGAALSVQSGFNRRDVNPFRIRRLDVFGTDTPGMLLRKMHWGCNDGSLRASLAYYWRAVTRRAGARSP